MREDWIECCFEDLLNYEQPTNYIVKSTEYNNGYETPVLTAGKSFIKGYTNETEGIFDNLPTIIFDDFTTSTQFVNFKFKVKSSAMKILVPTSELVNMNFAFYAMQVNQVRSDTHKRYWISVYAKKKFLLPPLPEQRAIVAKIEELFTDLDKGIADLKKAQDQLKVYRQAVLKKAFEGELTKEWREQHTNLRTAVELLEQIKEERQKHFQQQLENWRQAVKAWEENGKEGKKPNRPQKIKEYNRLTTEEIKELPTLPMNWSWEKFGNVCLKIMDGTHFSPKNISEGDYKYITAKNIKEGRIDLSKISYVTEKDHKEIYSRCDVKKGDVLYIKDGATTGRATVNYLDEEFSLLSSVGVFRTEQSLIVPKFLEHYLNAQITRNRMLSNIAGVAITRLTLVKLNNLTFLICSPKEQHQIVQEIESRLSVCDNLEESITESIEKAKVLRQSILKKAFEGSLLSEEEIATCKAALDYEPASVLLKKIKTKKKKA